MTRIEFLRFIDRKWLVEVLAALMSLLFFYAAVSKLADYEESKKEMLNQVFPREVHDFYPNEPLPDVLVVKSKNVLINKVYPTGAVRYVLEETDFLSVPRTNKEVTEEANRLFNKTWKTTDFGSPLDRAVVKGDLLKTDPPEVVTYKKKK